MQDIHFLINSSVLVIQNQTQTGNDGPGYGACGCGGPEWRRATYLNMSDLTQICLPAWELITTPRRSCARPSNATSRSCHSAMFPIQGIQYSQVCGGIIGYQVGHPQAFFLNLNDVDGPYIDGMSLTYGTVHDNTLGHLLLH